MKKTIEKLTLFIFLGLIGNGFTAWKKDGAFNPKEKIKRIVYEQETGTIDLEGTHPTTFVKWDELWEWDKNNLMSIKDSRGTEIKFSYQGKQVDRIDWFGGRFVFIC